MKIKSAQRLLKSAKGFTLIELLVVIAVIGILAAAVLIAINPLQKINQSKDAGTKEGLGQAASAMETYFTQNQSYPTTVAGLVGTTNELKSEPRDSSGASFTTTCSTAPCSSQSMYFTLNISDTTTAANRTPSGNACTSGAPCTVWCWRSTTGKIGPSTTTNCN